MYYVPDDTQFCGFYECNECCSRFLDFKIVPRMICPYCGEIVDMEIGPDDELPLNNESAQLLKVIEGNDEVLKMDTLLSLALTGGDYKWI